MITAPVAHVGFCYACSKPLANPFIFCDADCERRWRHPIQWTREQPGPPGYYWIRGGPFERTTIVEVSEDGWVYFLGNDVGQELADPSSDLAVCEWAGPLDAPK